ncbi:hypothetical protein PHET_12489 [Paragonimus heterotremus]|uniref:Uncharacterized protein n=1 Tax=Paragonimus heterotremus TaxID=100268 RepID=A0A8J4WDC9_9TREM|nr:hypothetical protein PHET_12489 [Paragonimus heterotremus]
MREKPFDERALLGHLKDLKLIDGVLYHLDQPDRKLIAPELEVAAVFQKVNTEIGRVGQLETKAAIRRRYR